MSVPDRQKTGLDDPRVIEALDEYLAALEIGQKPDRQEFLARHAEVADALAECLEGMEVLHDASSAPSVPLNTRTSPRPLVVPVITSGMPSRFTSATATLKTPV